MNETNRYVISHTNEGVLLGGDTWDLFTKAWFAIWFYMGMKRQLNMKNYWMKKSLVFHCPTIFEIIPCNYFMALTTCFHITNLAIYVRKNGLLEYDKLR